MRAGTLDRRITLRHRTLVGDVQGQEVETFVAYATVWASKRDATGREFLASQQTIAENTCRFIIRHRSDVLLTDRITFESLDYDIRQTAEMGRRQGLEIVATAVKP